MGDLTSLTDELATCTRRARRYKRLLQRLASLLPFIIGYGVTMLFDVYWLAAIFGCMMLGAALTHAVLAVIEEQYPG